MVGKLTKYGELIESCSLLNVENGFHWGLWAILKTILRLNERVCWRSWLILAIGICHAVCVGGLNRSVC